MQRKQRNIFILITLIILFIFISFGLFIYIKNINNQKSADNNIEYKMMGTPNPTYFYPQIVNYKNKETMDKVNTELAHELEFSGCPSDISQENLSWNLKLAIDYSKNDIFSVNVSGDYYCGGPYPVNNYSNTITFDMTTGEKITFENLFKNYEENKKEIINIIYGDTVLSSDKNDICTNVNTIDNIISNPQNYRISKDKKAIIVRPEYPHIIEHCINNAEISIEKLAPFLNENSILNRI